MRGKKIIAGLLVVTVAASGIGIYAGDENSYAQEEASYEQEAVYEGSYGNQLEEGSYSRYFYDVFVESYVCQEEDVDVYGIDYVGLAQPQDENGVIETKPDDLTFTGTFDDVSDLQEYGVGWFNEKSEEIGTAIGAAFDAFEKDYPQVFWLEGIDVEENLNMTYTQADKVGTGIVTIIVTPMEYEEGMMDYVDAFNEGVIKVCQNIESNTLGWEKDEVLRYIQDYIATELEYDFDAAWTTQNRLLANNDGTIEALNNDTEDASSQSDDTKNEIIEDDTVTEGSGEKYKHTAVSVFITDDKWDNKVVCDAYAKTFKIICDRLGYECALLMGVSINNQGEEETHLWNAVYLDGNWYAVDVTWDDQGEYISYKYFLAGNKSEGFYATYEEDHTATGTFSQYTNSKAFLIPQICQYGYYYTEDQGGETEEMEPVIEPETTTKTEPATEPETTASGSSSGTSTGSSTTNITTTNLVWNMSGLIKQKSYTGSEVKQNVTITCDGETLKEGTDYEISYSNNVNVGTATMTVTPVGKYATSSTSHLTYNYQITKISIKTVTAKKVKAQKYKKGKAIKPKVTLKFNGKKLKKGKDYTVSYKKNKKRGTATIVIKGKGNFSGKRKIKFKIK